MRLTLFLLLLVLGLAPRSWAADAATSGPVYVRGTPYWTYQDVQLRAVASIAVEGQRTLLVLTISNVGEGDFTVSPEDVKLIYAGGTTSRGRT